MSKVTFQLSLSPDTARYTGSQTTRQESKTYCASNGRIQLPNRMNFGKLYCNFFIMDMVAFMQGGIGHKINSAKNVSFKRTKIQGKVWVE